MKLTLGAFASVVAILVALHSAGWLPILEARHEAHVEEFVELQGKMLCRDCVEDCLEVCRRNAVTIEQCDCTHCTKVCSL